MKTLVILTVCALLAGCAVSASSDSEPLEPQEQPSVVWFVC